MTESFAEAAARLIRLLREEASLSDAEIAPAYPSREAARPLKRTAVSLGMQEMEARERGGEGQIVLWLYVPEREGGGALSALFSRVCGILLQSGTGVTGVKSGKIAYNRDLYAFCLPCTAQLVLQEGEDGEAAPLLAGIEIRGEIH